ncbi:outer membrane beta-barrel protein [Christiangramia forsetii]|uniref:Secreted protein n=2 Tax=Christiangramia forsetii TaxID=411153 RepID=A0M4P3_CHRFK|nr:hypothetical protein [Christiangramia forsetii]GGG22970.1 hypothetical protein GCM10011532_02590 [Christiangramia forsetii]CAL67588.1 secreted protein [Christiangramia forsetii KT0803]
MKLAKLTFVVVTVLLFHFNLSAQQEYENAGPDIDRPYRIGFKLGYPNILGGSVEYMLPVLNGKFGVSLDYSRLRSKNLFSAAGVNEDGTEDLDLNLQYIEGGINYYLFKPGKGLYVGMSYGNFKFDGTEDNIESENEPNKFGTRKIDFSNGSFNLKIGARWGGLFYFRPEIGYAFSPIPETIDATVFFDDGSTETQPQDLMVNDGLSPLFSGLIFNFGIGVAF